MYQHTPREASKSEPRPDGSKKIHLNDVLTRTREFRQPPMPHAKPTALDHERAGSAPRRSPDPEGYGTLAFRAGRLKQGGPQAAGAAREILKEMEKLCTAGARPTAKDLANLINYLRHSLRDDKDKQRLVQLVAQYLPHAARPTSQAVANTVNGLAQMRLRNEHRLILQDPLADWLNQWLERAGQPDPAHLANTINGLAQLRLPPEKIARLDALIGHWLERWLPHVPALAAIDIANTINGLAQLKLSPTRLHRLRPLLAPWVCAALPRARHPHPVALANTVNALTQLRVTLDDGQQEAMLQWICEGLKQDMTLQPLQAGLILNGVADLSWSQARYQKLKPALQAWFSRHAASLSHIHVAPREGMMIYRGLFFWSAAECSQWQHHCENFPAECGRRHQSVWEKQVEAAVTQLFHQWGEHATVENQVPMGDYHIDIVVQLTGRTRPIAIECCGRDYHAEHEPVRDHFVSSKYEIVKVWSDAWAARNALPKEVCDKLKRLTSRASASV